MARKPKPLPRGEVDADLLLIWRHEGGEDGTGLLQTADGRDPDDVLALLGDDLRRELEAAVPPDLLADCCFHADSMRQVEYTMLEIVEPLRKAHTAPGASTDVDRAIAEVRADGEQGLANALQSWQARRIAEYAALRGFKRQAIAAKLSPKTIAPNTQLRPTFMTYWTGRLQAAGVIEAKAAALIAARVVDRVWNRNSNKLYSWELLAQVDMRLKAVVAQLAALINQVGHDRTSLFAEQDTLLAQQAELASVTPIWSSAQSRVADARVAKKQADAAEAATVLATVGRRSRHK